ncbi:MAG: hypothetical protein WCF63_07040 [Acidimicrobiales bacterium]
MARIIDLKIPAYDDAWARLASLADSVKSRAEVSTQNSKTSTLVKVAGVIVVVAILVVVVKKLRGQRVYKSHSVETSADGNPIVTDIEKVA